MPTTQEQQATQESVKKIVSMLAEAETKIHQFAMQIKLPAYGQDSLSEVQLLIKRAREGVFNGFPCAHSGCPSHDQARLYQARK